MLVSVLYPASQKAHSPSDKYINTAAKPRLQASGTMSLESPFLSASEYFSNSGGVGDKGGLERASVNSPYTPQGGSYCD